MKLTPLLILISAWGMSLTGCATHSPSPRHNVQFLPGSPIKYAPTENAQVVHGTADQAAALFEKAALPHNSPRERYHLGLRALESLTAQLGSDDYVVIGEVYGTGNAYSNMDLLRAALVERAAAAGGDVVFVFRSGADERAVALSLPGYGTTTAHYSAYPSGGYVHATDSSHTTYTPGATVAGVMRFPYANGLVLKHIPGAAARRERVAALNDSQLEQFFDELAVLEQHSGITYDAFAERFMDILTSIEGQANPRRLNTEPAK